MDHPHPARPAHSGDDARPYTVSRPLPPYRGLVAVDAKDFTGHASIEHGAISEAIQDVLRLAFKRADIADVWHDRRFPNSTGDGYVFGFDPTLMPFVIHPWLSTLQEVLTDFNVHAAGTARIRLRVSLHVGPLPDAGSAFDGNGTPRNDTHRLLDSRPVKAVLAASSAYVTQVAAILSDRCYQDAVASGYTGRHPDHFIEVPATVEGKSFAQRAWLHVPAPSGPLYDRRVLGDRVIDDQQAPDSGDGQRRPERRTAAQRRTVVYRADHGNVNSGTVHGGQRVHNGDVRGDDVRVESVGGDFVRGNSVRGDSVRGGKAGTVYGNQGDTFHGDQPEDRR
ncbi:hypothetical protein JJV70_20195 [Streptomyces sp. JJ66]|uniref:hypothetical protein n=1 Tax=Streptomyces sp. JJ66 TaxID=2803843 RepID=UPI001C57BD4D|nr:hypothetical protein [Streptomyces sp. JJ66]MBW1604380.1 hypothetical protein [Streptomyces sp. JJ66]